MAFWIIFFSMVVVFIAMFFSAQANGYQKGRMLFGVTIPPSAFEEPRVAKIQKDHKRDFMIFGIVFFILLIGTLFTKKMVSINVIYFSLWTAGMIILHPYPYKLAHRKLKKIKKDEGWFVGEKRVVNIDTKVTRLKETMVVKPYWFLIPTITSLLMLVGGLLNNSSVLIITGGASALLTGLFFVVYRLFSKMRTKTYCEDSDLNIAVNKVSRRYWSILWPLLATYQTFSAFLTYFAINREVVGSILVPMILVLPLIPTISIIYTRYKISHTVNDLLSMIDKEIITDEDDYWIDGIIYCNPNDKSIMVEKRFGIGTTVNTGTKWGKIIVYGTYIFIAVILIPISLMLFSNDFFGHSLEISQSNKIDIKTTLYGHSFIVDEIEEINLIDAIPSSFRTNGIGTARYLRGNFSVSGYGRSKMYVYQNNPPYIVMKLDDIHVIYNEKDADETLELYQRIKDLIGK